MINRKTCRRLGLSDEAIAQIRKVHRKRKRIFRALACASDRAKYIDKWRENEFALQELWGFPRDANYHRFWELPGCTCPKMDNEDRWGTRWAVMNENCPLHGRSK